MKINQNAIEQVAETTALRVLTQTLAMLVFEQSGLSAEKVRSLGNTYASEIGGADLAGVDEDYAAAVRVANANAIKSLFDDIADGMRSDTAKAEGDMEAAG